MGRILMGICAALLLGLIASYFLIPQTIVFSKVMFLRSTIGAAERAFLNSKERGKWWPQQTGDSLQTIVNGVHNLENYKYEFPEKTYSGSTVKIIRGDKTVTSSIHFVPLKIDSIAVKWKSELPETKNPFKRIANYLTAIAIKKNMAQVLEAVKIFLNKDENIYGLRIIEEKVKDTILLSTKWTSAAYPSTEVIYQKIDELKKYIQANNGIETNHPMLNIFENQGTYANMVAIPLNRELPENDAFVLKKMIPGRILTTETIGGVYASKASVKKLELYIDDHKMTSPAIPFESLVSNRMAERDSNKWVTKVYYPIY